MSCKCATARLVRKTEGDSTVSSPTHSAVERNLQVLAEAYAHASIRRNQSTNVQESVHLVAKVRHERQAKGGEAAF